MGSSQQEVVHQRHRRPTGKRPNKTTKATRKRFEVYNFKRGLQPTLEDANAIIEISRPRALMIDQAMRKGTTVTKPCPVMEIMAMTSSPSRARKGGVDH